MFIFILLWVKFHHTPRDFGGRQTHKLHNKHTNLNGDILTILTIKNNNNKKKKLLSIFEPCRNNIICMKLFPIKKKKSF